MSGDQWQVEITDYMFSTVYWVVHRLASGGSPYSVAEQRFYKVSGNLFFSKNLVLALPDIPVT